ncbi:hypothetical protein Z043_125066, partial [Scleropages formosus]
PLSCSEGFTELGYYNGSVSQTDSGSACLRWTEFPDYMQQYPGRGLGDHSYCRNPDRASNPWCFYRQNSGAIGWAYCDCHQGAARLAGGTSTKSGRLEVYLNGQWGAVCDTHWTDRDASVICRQLGQGEIGTALQHSYFGPGSGLFHFERLGCRGNENSLLECRNRRFVTGDCNHGNEAGVVCAPPEAVSVRHLRLPGVLCDHAPVLSVPTWHRFHGNICCETQRKSPRSSQTITGVTFFGSGNGAPLRLAGGLEDFEGRVEVYRNGRWGTICDDRWDDIDAEVVCRQLGLGGIPKAWSWAHFGPGEGPILLNNVQCTGNELSLEECPHSGWEQHSCDHMEDAGVSCNPYTSMPRPPVHTRLRWPRLVHGRLHAPRSLLLWGWAHRRQCGTASKTAYGVLRLVGADGPWEGRVEVYHSGDWGTVCDDNWTEQHAQVVCRQLGFRGRAELAPDGAYGEGAGFILLDEVRCEGSEASLLDCGHAEWGRHDCSHGEDVGVRCERGGDGNVVPEVSPAAGKRGVSKARSLAYFGEGRGPIHLDNVRCSGKEAALGECPAEGPGTHDCRHSEDAGVICDYAPEPVRDVAAATQSCGLRPNMQRRRRRIVGGDKSFRGDWPWQVSLWLKSQSKGNHPLCGATLINSCWVLTAAHCFKRFGGDPSRYVLRLGDYHTEERDDFERSLSPHRIVVHGKYRSQGWEYDIALLRLRGAEGNCVAFNPHTNAACLPGPGGKRRERPAACVITGWGVTEYSRTLLQAWVPILPSWRCKKRYGERFTGRMLCAGSLSAHRRADSCQGDSGGPLVCQDERGRWVLTGVISWGHGCGHPSYPGVYTRVSRFLRWIQQVTHNKTKI